MNDKPTWPATFQCPHCGFQQKSAFEEYETRPQVRYCYEDEGGCGATFAVTGTVRVTVTTTAHKIEGLGPIDQDYAAELLNEREQKKRLEEDADWHSRKER